ncbi:MAG: hypothetical protein CMK59_02915 [Proteobacteria bacterium]|nr:hypothetical protein [Pseudomonadota bacterium]
MSRSHEKKLRNRKDIDNKDIPDIIARADELQTAALEEEAKNKDKSYRQDVKNLGKKLDIDEKFIEQAISEKHPPPKEAPKKSTLKKNKPEDDGFTFKLKPKDLIFIGIVMMLLFLYMQKSNTPQAPSPSKAVSKQTQIERVVIKEKIIEREIERKILPPAKPKLKEKIKNTDPVEDEIEDDIEDDIEDIIEDDIEDIIEDDIEDDIIDTQEDNDGKEILISEKQEQKSKPQETPKVETNDDPPPKRDKAPKSNLGTVGKLLVGEWKLVAYQLFDEGYFTVPITKEPLELVENWDFQSNQRFLHVMDTDLSFSGSYQLEAAITLPEQPSVLNKHHFVLHNQKVRSNIPGIKHNHVYYYGEIDQNRLVLYRIGNKLSSEKQPPQGHEYKRIK